MKKRFKGFTLIECIIALAILGIASLTMAQIYASVSLRNKNNHLTNTSLSNQMAYVEKYTNTEATAIYYNEQSGSSKPDSETQTGGSNKPPHVSTSGTVHSNYVQIVKVASVDALGNKTLSTTDVYSYPVDTYILLSRDNNDKSSKDPAFGDEYKDLFDVNSNVEDNYNLRYKYILGHSN